MSHSLASIKIGGTVSRNRPCREDPNLTVLEGLYAAIEQAYTGEPTADCDVNQETIFNISGHLSDNRLWIQLGEVPNGEFFALEEFCQAEGLSYHRWSDMSDQNLGESVYWVPDMQEPLILWTDATQEEMVEGKVVREAIQLLSQHPFCFLKDESGKSPAESAVKATTRVEVALKILRCLCPDIPEIPEFRLVD